MHNHVTAHDFEFIGAAIAGLLFLSWLFGGRRIVAPPASFDLPQTFASSSVVSFVFLAFCVFGTVISGLISISALFYMSDADAGSHWFRLGAGMFMLLAAVFSAFGVKMFGTLVIWPDRLNLTDDGIFARIRGKERHWAWDNIADSKVLFPGSKQEMLQLILKNPDPDEERRLARLPWAKKRDPRIVWMDDMWKPTALLTTGDMAVRDAILAVLKQHR